MSFINERPAFKAPPGASKSLQDQIEEINKSMRSIDEQIRSIPSDSGVMHTYTPRKHLTFKANGNQQVDEHNGSYIVMGSDNPGHSVPAPAEIQNHLRLICVLAAAQLLMTAMGPGKGGLLEICFLLMLLEFI